MPPRADGPTRPEPIRPLRESLPAEEAGLRRFVRSLRVPAGEVDDVVQEAFARAWRSRASYDPSRPLGAWLRATALRVWLDLRARRQRQPAGLPHDVADGRTPVGALRHDLEVRLSQLGSIERDVLLRFHRDGDSLRDIAKAFDMPLNTVKSHLHRARQRLASRGAW